MRDDLRFCSLNPRQCFVCHRPLPKVWYRPTVICGNGVAAKQRRARLLKAVGPTWRRVVRCCGKCATDVAGYDRNVRFYDGDVTHLEYVQWRRNLQAVMKRIKTEKTAD
jgi:hypothetical protein